MAAELELRALKETDDRSSFSCGQPDLDRYFQHYAGQNQFKLRLSVTYVALVRARIVGFATVTVATLERLQVPNAKARGRLPAYPLPVLRIARLGVDVGAQQLGVGSALLRHLLQLALEQRDALGCVVVVTDAKPAAVAFYERYGFVRLLGVREGALVGEPTPLFLSIDSIAASRD